MKIEASESIVRDNSEQVVDVYQYINSLLCLQFSKNIAKQHNQLCDQNISLIILSFEYF